MKIISGDVESLLGLVRKRVDGKIDELESSLENETDEKLGKAKSQAKQLRDQIIQQAGRDAERLHNNKIMSAQQEAKQTIIGARGKIEESLFNEIRRELLDFVNGKKKIGALDYEDLIKKAIDSGRKRKIEFSVKRQEDGVILRAEGKELDLRVDSMMRTLRTLPFGEALGNK